MHCLIASHKACWRDDESPTGYSTDGGFAHQMAALSDLFDSTEVLVVESRRRSPGGLTPLSGKRFRVSVLPEPRGTGWSRKLGITWWCARWGAFLAAKVRRADAVHTPVPGDVGGLVMLLSLVLRKPLFIRQCGTWGEKGTVASRCLAWLLPRIARGQTVVMATGGGDDPPEPGNRRIEWVFATSLSEAEMARLPAARPWKPGTPLRLVTVGRLSVKKNAESIIRALPAIQSDLGGVTLDIVGDGPAMHPLAGVASSLGMADHVRFRGNVSHEGVLEILSESHLFVFPTQVTEGFPKAVLEALACGLPVIASSVSVLPNLIGTGSGVILQAPDACQIAIEVLRLCRAPESVAEIGRNAKDTARDYTLEVWRDRIGSKLSLAWGELRTADEPGRFGQDRLHP